MLLITIKELIKNYSVNKQEIIILLSYLLKKSYTDVFFSNKLRISQNKYYQLLSFIKRRQNQEPISKIIGKTSFYNHEFFTNYYTLDPRPETELIVDLFQKYFSLKQNKLLKILDLGCGTGCIGLSILDIYPNALLDLADISIKALDVAKKNSNKLNLFNKCRFIFTNWFSNIYRKYDIIVSNPPYIAENYPLENEVLFDPKIALFAGKNGLEAYMQILPQAHLFLNKNGMLFIEIGIGQLDHILSITNKLKLIEIKKDLQNINRTLVFKNEL